MRGQKSEVGDRQEEGGSRGLHTVRTRTEPRMTPMTRMTGRWTTRELLPNAELALRPPGPSPGGERRKALLQSPRNPKNSYASSIRFYPLSMHFLCTFYALSMRFLYRFETSFAAKTGRFPGNMGDDASKKIALFVAMLRRPATDYANDRRVNEWRTRERATDCTTIQTWTRTTNDKLPALSAPRSALNSPAARPIAPKACRRFACRDGQSGPCECIAAARERPAA